MKILFASEVFPMRNSFTEHSLVSREFLTNISSMLHDKNNDISDARLLCNNQTLELLFTDFIKLVPSVIRLTESTSKLAGEALQDWSLGGLDAWKEYVAGKGDFAGVVYQELLNIHQLSFDFDMIVCWGENGVYDSIARKLDIPCLHIEISSTRKPFFEGRMIDCLGANGSASFKNIKLDDLKANLTPPGIDFWSAYNNIEGEANTEVLGFDDSSLTYWEDDNTLDIFTGKKIKTVLIGLQLFDDANTQRHSIFTSPLHFLETVIPELTEAGYKVIVKTHPGAIHRPINFIEQNKALAYARNFSNCYIYDQENDHRNYLSLLRSVDLVVVINSSLGFESSLLGKVVVIMGDALFKISDVYPTLQEAMKEDFDRNNYLDKLAYLTYFFSKYVFIDRKYLLKGAFYTAINQYWEDNKKSLLKYKFPVEAYIKGMDDFSRKFIVDSSKPTYDDYQNILSDYILNSPKRDDQIEEKKDCLILKRPKLKVDLVEGKSEFNIDSLYLLDGELYLNGWAIEHQTQVPPVLIILIIDNVVIHTGRASHVRIDVQEHFNLSHSTIGFRFRLPFTNTINITKLLFVYSDSKGELVDISTTL
tara:strand:+ start:8934 stop:10706 length:1773 start_codon:yes stop_codon:yes gene_type:complete